MGRITTGSGLISGFPIEDTVNKLIALAGKPRDTLQDRNDKLEIQQNVYTAISTGLLKLQLTTVKLTNVNIFDTRSAASSDASLLRVTSSGTPALGTYQFTPLRKASSQQLLSSGFSGNDVPIGAGQLKLRFGGAIDSGIDLGALNGGRGVAPGSIRITDRSGTSATIDLRTARSVDDVLRLINANDDIAVRAEAPGDRFVLFDESGQTLSNLKVQEVGGGSTAADLGLAGINAAANQAQGQDVIYLGRDTLLSSLNNGNGVRFATSGADLRVNFADGSSPLDIDFTTPGVAGTKAIGTTNASAGLNGQLVFSAVKAGAEFADVEIRFQNDSTIQQGSETAVYDATAKTLTFKIKEGATTANDIIASFGRSPTAAAAFTVRKATGSNGTGLISTTDTVTTTSPPATATTPGTAGPNSALKFTALREGPNYNGVHIYFVDDPGVTAGSETVTYNDSNPANKQLTFRIDAGATTANNIVAALQNDPQLSQLFKAENVSGSNGTGLVDSADNVTTSGSEMIEPVPSKTARTIGELLDVLNAASPTRLSAQISASGDSIELTDLTSGVNPFNVDDLAGSKAAADLGLDANPVGNTITGRLVLAGLDTALLTSLNGGAGIGPLGTLNLTDRSGANASVNLASARTLDDVIAAINASGIGITASLNSGRNGLALADTTGQSTSDLIVANGDGTNSATKLGIAFSGAATSVTGSTLNLQTVNENTLLSKLNGGAGISSGSFTIFNTASGSGKIDLSIGNIKTVGDLVEAIDALNIGVDARLNETGDGIQLIDTIGGSNTLRVQDVNGTAARDLRLTGAAVDRVIDGNNRKVIEGSTTFTVDVSSTDTLTTLVTKINALDAGFSASVFNTGAGANPYRLSISSQRSGSAGNLVWDTSDLDFSLQETVRGQDALLLFGTGGAGTISASTTNNFKDILPGVSLEIVGESAAPVNVTVSSSASGAVDAIKALVDAYNTVRAQLAEATKFTAAASESDTVETGPLFGESSILRVDTDLSRLFSQRILNAGSLKSLGAVGIKLEQDGTLSFDETAFNSQLAADPQGVRDFFTTAETGFVARLRSSIDQLSAGENSVVMKRLDAIASTIETNTSKIADWNVRLTKERDQLLMKFYRMEQAISKMQTDLSAITNLQSQVGSLFATKTS